MKLKVKKLHPHAVIPTYATEGAACFDLHAVLPEEEFDPASHYVLEGVPAIDIGTAEPLTFCTGLAFEVPLGHVMLIFSRSGHGFKEGVRLANCVGVIDSDYRGELKVRLHRDVRGASPIKHLDRIAQAMILPVPLIYIQEVEGLTETVRGDGGFGSTGMRPL